ncbi:MAG: class A beta-lactamase-related serine hydrolase [Blastocatellia bacterium]|nr:class A beta-lactamase-related serine hydrolase [Blastocatellia bacterium]MCS7156204.1 class A beta-lactamase-related serine hydrolase [Blastocatellia bacterium]MCX7751446.1 class A beta-lactamase-related serine hydrolase [Blastocatellia bacterium]MDW8169159.1 serine hydrolase [Acidobacteriota bacterium]MDW8256020.1 serine hydrolase [Acidobacteriota bacterium]
MRPNSASARHVGAGIGSRAGRRAIAIALLVVWLSPSASFRQADVRTRLEAMIAASGAEAVAVAYYDFATGEEILLRADDPFHAASTMKVPVMMEVFRQAQEGRLSLDDHLIVKNEFRSLADGSAFSLAVENDADPALYERIGRAVPIRELVRAMIVRSSNLATNLLIERVTAARVQELMEAIGASGMRVLRGVEDRRAFERGLNNTTTARALLVIFRRLAEGRVVSPESCAEMVRILLDQEFNDGIPAGLPASARVAHKTGAIHRIAHDAGIIYPSEGPPYVLIVLTRGIAEEQSANRLIAEISRLMYEHTLKQRAERIPQRQ